MIAAEAPGAAGPAGDRYVGTLFLYLSGNLDFFGDDGRNSLLSSAPVNATSYRGVNTIAPMATFTMEDAEKVALSSEVSFVDQGRNTGVIGAGQLLLPPSG